MTGDFKVVIAGGGVAGLVLANMLEAFNLDYILLEAHSAIAPPVGASIGMFPNGLRILDQIGCYEPIKALFGGEVPYNVSHTRDENGEILSSINAIFDHLERRHGYGLLFFDRQSLLEILYDHLKHKERVQLKKRVSAVDLSNKGVQVTCADGSLVTGTILVGADGVHSAVRKSMHDLGSKIEPGYFDPEEPDRVPCYYSCSFGIAQHVPGWAYGEQSMVTGKGRSQLVISGPDERVYWFLFEKLAEVKYGRDIPRYTEQDEAEFVKRNYNVPITPAVTFGQVFENKISSALTPLHEVVWKKWFFRRIITLGDSAHKPNPIGGQGGNGAIESCAELLNAILRMKKSRGDTLSNLADEEATQIFSEVQSARHERATTIINHSHKTQALFAYENPFMSTLVHKVIGPLAGNESTLNQLAPLFLAGTTLHDLPVPSKPRALPFHDELPAKPVGGKVSNYVRYGFTGGMCLALLAATKKLCLPFTEVSAWSQENVQLRWLGKTPGSFLNFLVSVLAIPIFSKDPSARLHLANFLPQLISPLLIYAIEGSRLGNQATPLALPVLFSAGMQVQGIARAAPFHAILSAFFGLGTPTGRQVPLPVAQSLVPAITLGFVIPTIMVLLPTPRVAAWEKWSAIWQFAPVLFKVLAAITAKALKKRDAAKKPEQSEEMERYTNKDVSSLKAVYTYAFAVQAAVHVSTLAYGCSHPDVSIFQTFFKLSSHPEQKWPVSDLAAKLATFFRYDMLFGVIGYLGSQLYSIWDLRRLGYVKTSEAVNAALAVAGGQFLVGPGATWAGLWYWREDKLASVAQ